MRYGICETYGKANLKSRFLRLFLIREGYIPMNMSKGWFKGRERKFLVG